MKWSTQDEGEGDDWAVGVTMGMFHGALDLFINTHAYIQYFMIREISLLLSMVALKRAFWCSVTLRV